VAMAAQFGVPALSANAAEARVEIHGPVNAIYATCVFTGLILVPTLLWVSRTSRTTKWVAYAGLAFICVQLAMLASRYTLAACLCTVIVIRHYIKKRIRAKQVAAFMAGAFVLLSVGGYVRDLTNPSSSMDWIQFLGIREQYVPVVYASLYVRYSVGTLRDVVQMIPHGVPYQGGAITFAALKVFLPGRQEPPDMFFKEILNREFVGAGEPATLLGPFYADWGLPGIFFGMLVFGVIFGWAHRAMQDNPTPLRIAIYAWSAQTAFMGLFNTVFPFITTFWIPFVWFCMDRVMKSQAAAVAMPGNSESVSALEPA